jgi:DNA-binding PadR family transcriptional regulator
MQSMPPSSYLGEFEHLILLAVLQCGDAADTVSVRQTLASRGGRRVARGALFTALDRLETKGLVRSRLGPPVDERGGRARRHYVVTAAGRQAVRAAQAAVTGLARGLDTVLGRS